MTLFHALGAIGASGLSKGSLQFITSATGSAAASISINSCFSASYSHYLVMRSASCSAAAGTAFEVRLRVAGTDDSGANYRQQYIDGNSTTVSGGRSTALNRFSAGMGTTETTAMGFARLWISNPFDAVRTTAWGDQGYSHTGTIGMTSLVYEHDLTTSYDGITVYPASGTITGTVYVYGLAI